MIQATGKEAYEGYLEGLFTYDEMRQCIYNETRLYPSKSYEEINDYLDTWYVFGEFQVSYQTFLYFLYHGVITRLTREQERNLVDYYSKVSQKELNDAIYDVKQQITSNYEMAESSRNGIPFLATPESYEYIAEEQEEMLTILVSIKEKKNAVL